MTKAKLGSHVPNKSKKPITLAGFDMPESINPIENKPPNTKAKIFFMMMSPTHVASHTR